MAVLKPGIAPGVSLAARRALARQRAIAEALEFRIVLSSYTENLLGSFVPDVTGGWVEAPVVQDCSGDLFGTTAIGGPANVGTVFEVARGSGAATAIASFNNYNGRDPESGLVFDSSGDLFGTTGFDGPYGWIYEVAAGTQAITDVASFNGLGEAPSTLTVDSAGNLFGTLQDNGPGDGCIFELPQGSSAVTSLASFGANQGYPVGGATFDPQGNIFGVTEQIGTSKFACVYELASGTNSITTLASLNTANGLNDAVRTTPGDDVYLDSSGDLFATAEVGGANNDGTVFELPRGSGMITALASFNGANGDEPLGGVVVDPAGNVFGTTFLGGPTNQGTLFEIAAGSGSITTLTSFIGANGWGPEADLRFDSSGNLLGTTWVGGANRLGTVFNVAAGSSVVTTLASFGDLTGSQPVTGVVVDSSGNVFGTTQDGGASGGGVVFELGGDGIPNTLDSFAGINTDPTGLVLDSAGDLFGATAAGGASGDGTVFEVTQATGKITTLATFNGTNGSGPSNVTLDSSGDLFGTTTGLTAKVPGTVFEIAQGSQAITTLASFGTQRGNYPLGGVAIDSSGNLFGTNFLGGANSAGSVFEIASGTSAVTTVASFNRTNGGSPKNGVVLDTSGDIFGMTSLGGAGAGSVFEIARGSRAITVVASLSTGSTMDADNGLAIDSSGNLFGTTIGGSDTMFEVARGTSIATRLPVLTSATSVNGVIESPLFLDSSGDIFGTNGYDGPGYQGSVYELMPMTAVTVTYISPNNGPTTGGTTITFHGTNFNGETAVNFGGALATNVVVSPDGTQLTATLPPGVPGVVNVSVTTPAGTSPTSPGSAFTYVVPPVVLSVTPEDAAGHGIAAGSAAKGQRSMETQIAVVFSVPVNLASGAFNLNLVNNYGSGTNNKAADKQLKGVLGTPVNPSGDGLNWIIPILSNGTNSYALKGTQGGISGASLDNGVYNLSINAADVTVVGASAVVMTTNYTSADWHRLYGDVDNAGRVFNSEYAAFVPALTSIYASNGAANYNEDLDYDGDGRVFNSDFQVFLADFGSTRVYTEPQT